MANALALACLETRVALVDHIGSTPPSDHTAETVPLFGGFQRIDDFHDLFLDLNRGFLPDWRRNILGREPTVNGSVR